LADVRFTEAEVRRALKGSKPGTAPGDDGLPVGVYQGCKDVFVPLLARVFSAAGAEGHVHAGGLDGVVVSLYKAGERADISNYRPITLLNTDYRVLAKVLASRLQRVVGTVISPEQTAFLEGRRIGENIYFLRALAEALPSQSEAVVACLDFRKAYDTVDRAFLLRLMGAMGVPDEFLALVEMLLAGTRARACVNGYVSRPALYEAGVRQGCPLAPLLYLFVGQALLCHVKASFPGVRLGEQLFSAVQYADDAQVLLPCWGRVPAFVEAMAVFGRASGQFVNLSKTLLLPVGPLARRLLWLWVDAGSAEQPPASLAAVLAPVAAPGLRPLARGAVPPGCSVCGLRVVGQAKVLGVLLSASGGASVDWEARGGTVKGAQGRIAALRLSAFGRGLSSAAYGVPTLLFHAEHAGLPPRSVITGLTAATAKLVDRGQAPSDSRRRFCGVRHELLVGSPGRGGFGALPWEEHMLARHVAWFARWAAASFLGSARPPYAAAVLRLWRVGPASVADFLTSLVVPVGALGPGGRPLPEGPDGLPLREPLAGWVTAFRRLPVPSDVGRAPLANWCAHVPLFHNPMVVLRGAGGELLCSYLHTRFPLLFSRGRFETLGQLAQGLLAVQDSACQAAWPGGVLGSLLPQGPASLLCSGWAAVLVLLLKVVLCLEASWWKAARAGAPLGAVLGLPGSAERREEAQANMLKRLGWPGLPGVESRRPVMLVGLTTKQATQLQQAPLVQLRGEKWEAFRGAACRLRPASAAAVPVACVGSMFAAMWKLPWDNQRKEVLWRLVYDALPTVERLHVPGVHRCQCGVLSPGREHHFWDCPVAVGVRGQLQRALPGGHPALQREQLWLAIAPAGVEAGVWRVVVLAALGAMERGRRVTYAWRLQHSPVAPDPAALPLDMQLEVAGRAAAVGFWDYLQDFVSGGPKATVALGELVGASHAFIRCVRGVFSVNLPPGGL
jgi:hypothetical protein